MKTCRQLLCLKNLPYVKTGFPFPYGLRVKWKREIIITTAIIANILRVWLCQALCYILYMHYLIQSSTTLYGRYRYPHFT